MALETLTENEARDLIRAYFRNLIPGADVSDLTDYDVQARVLAALFAGNQAQAEYLLRQILPSTAEGTFLELHAQAVGTSKAPAAAAVGHVLLVGAASSVQPAGSVLTHSDGSEYTTDDNATLLTAGFSGKTTGPQADCSRKRLLVTPNTTGMVAGDVLTVSGVTSAIKEVFSSISVIELWHELPTVPATSTAITAATGAVVAVTASEADADGNKPPSDVLTLSAPGAGVTAATTVLELAGGGDQETDEELRGRIQDFRANRPGSGNGADFRAWARETPEVRLDDAFVYPGRRGLGTVDVYPFGVEGARQVSQAVVDLVTAYLVERVAFADDISVAPTSLEVGETDVTLTVTSEVGYEADWLGTRTSSGVPTTTDIPVTVNPIGTIEIGDRILVPLTIAGRPRTVQTDVTGLTATAIQCAALPVAPAAAVVIRPGGPLGASVISVIEELFDDLGPGDTTATLQVSTRVPPPSEAWPDVLRLARLVEAVMGIVGVANVTFSAPGADVTPSVAKIVKLGDLTITFATL